MAEISREFLERKFSAINRSTLIFIFSRSVFEYFFSREAFSKMTHRLLFEDKKIGASTHFREDDVSVMTHQGIFKELMENSFTDRNLRYSNDRPWSITNGSALNVS